MSRVSGKREEKREEKKRIGREGEKRRTNKYGEKEMTGTQNRAEGYEGNEGRDEENRGVE